MANPNIVNVQNIYANNSLTAVTTDGSTIINNAVSSGKVYKVNSVVAANIDGTSNYAITLQVYSQDDLGGTAYAIASTLNVPADSSAILIDKNSSIYLKEDQSLGATASANSKIQIVASWEEIS